MKHFFLIANRQNESAKILMQETAELIRRDPSCTVKEDPGSGPDGHTDPEDVPSDTEGVIVFGGDGTIIRAVRDLKPLALPLIGVNAGTLGYLAETDPGSIADMVARLKNDRFFIEERMMLRGQILKAGAESDAPAYEDTGLNDVVLSGADGTRVVSFSVYVDGEFLKSYVADGLILATPTGSTAYNLSAGGPIVMPSAEMLLLTPLNAHTFMSRTIVLPGDCTVTVELAGKSGTNALVHFDGAVYPDLYPGDRVCIRRADEHARLIRLNRDSFTEILRKKLEN